MRASRIPGIDDREDGMGGWLRQGCLTRSERFCLLVLRMGSQPHRLADLCSLILW
jgi:hypothetical protein